MVRHFQKNSNKKNDPSLRAKIIAHLEKHPRYPNDLYDACARGDLSRSEFQQLLNEMETDGEIHISQNGRVLLPKLPSADEIHTSQSPEPIGKFEDRTNEVLVHCLVNRSRCLSLPEHKKCLNNHYYAQQNYKAEQIPLDSVCEETLLKGYHFIPGEFRRNPDSDIGIRNAENWKSQQLFIIEYDDTTENTLAEFIEARPFLKENAWFVTESIRSGYNDPDDEKCNGQLRVRIVFCMPRVVNTTDERLWIYDALENSLPGCDTGSANNMTNGGLGNAGAKYVKIGKTVNIDWFHSAIQSGKKADQEKRVERERAEEERKRKQTERAAIGFTEREGELPLEALAKADPSLFLGSMGLTYKGESGIYRLWGRPEKQGDTALSVWLSDHDNWQIRIFANSIPVPPTKSGESMPFTQFYCNHELQTDIEGLAPDTAQWKDINSELASRGYGSWLSDAEFRKKYRNSKRKSVKEVVEKAPPVEIREGPAFPYFSIEERAVVRDVLSLDPDAGWHGPTPVFTTRYEYLHPLTENFKLNGQPTEVEKRRVWSTLFEKCEHCGAVTARWVDRYLLTAGFYCDGCHTDYHLGSYLELELARKLPNSIMSEYQGFLGDDPEFADFRLWEPGIMAHLGAAMSTGKTTAIDKRIIEFALQGLGKGIIAVPRISLARFLAHYLRGKHGFRSWGLWHEGCLKADRFIGDFGAIVCLPSLPRAVESARDAGVSRLYIAIDEIDFCYNLLSLSIEQSTAVKKCLRDALASTGLVVSGQTESTLALEALADELECEQVQGFYNTAKPADGCVIMHKHPDVKGKSDAVLCGVMDDIPNLLSAGHNAYTFYSSRRDGDLIANEFIDENPVCYNAYTKGDRRADAVLRNQRLTDSRLFIGTSAAGVGISILDPKAYTIIASGLIHGSRDSNMLVQMCVRDRGRCGVSFHYTDYELPLPVSPTENEKVSLYHEAVKQASSRYAHLPSHSICKIAYAQALSYLADFQIETYVSHHLGTVGNMPVYQASVLMPEPKRIDSISLRRSTLIRAEREKKIENARIILENRSLLTSSEIRIRSNKGELSPNARLAHELANDAARAVGWNDKIDRYVEGDPFDDILDDTDIDVVLALASNNINVDSLVKKRRGYLAVKFSKWAAHLFQTALEKSKSDLVNDGLGVEITAIHDDRFLGEILTVLLDRLVGEVFDSASLAMEVRDVLQATCSSGKTFGSEIESGALGASGYRKARFLHCADDVAVVKWVRAFVAEWYPAFIAKKGETYGIRSDHKWDLYRDSFLRWLMHQPGFPDDAHVTLDIFQSTELPNPNTELKAQAREKRRDGITLTEISKKLGVNVSTVSRWCRDIPKSKPDADVILEEKVLELKAHGMSIRKIANALKVSRGKVERILKSNKVS